MKNPKVLAGILYTIENEFEGCKKAILNQENAHVEDFVLNNLPKKVAHDTLYKSFEEKATDFDFFVKVDADMVIENKNLFRDVFDLFNQHRQIKMITVPVLDFFSGRLINGMHFFRNDVRWNRTDSELVFTDDAPVLKKEILQAPGLAPAALHCPNPSEFQAFHYGMHKAIKLLTALERKDERRLQRLFHFRNILYLKDRYKKTRDKRILFSLAGVSSVLNGDLELPHINYDNPFAKEFFDREIKNMGSREIYRDFNRKLGKLVYSNSLSLMYLKLKLIEITRYVEVKQGIKNLLKKHVFKGRLQNLKN